MDLKEQTASLPPKVFALSVSTKITEEIMKIPEVFAEIPKEWVTKVPQTKDTQQIGCMVWVSNNADGSSTWRAQGPIACCCVMNSGLDSIQTSIPAGQNLVLPSGWGLSPC
jgi:hypothetical protein